MTRTAATDLEKLLSVTMATMASLGALMSAMGQRSPWTVLLLWTAAIVSVVVTDLGGWFHIGRRTAVVAPVVIVAFFLPSCLRLSGEALLFVLAEPLVYLQIVLLFQKKDGRIYRCVAAMSLLQVTVATLLGQGVGFGVLLVIYMMLGLVGMTLLVLYRGGGVPAREKGDRPHLPERPATSLRPVPGFAQMGTVPLFPPRDGMPDFTSHPSQDAGAGVVRELFARLGVMGAGTLGLAMVIFLTVPRLGQPAWRGALPSPRRLVGFSDQITLGEMGEILESRDEVMRVRLLEKKSQRPYPVYSDLYFRGAVATRYQRGHWFRDPAFAGWESAPTAASPRQIVRQRITVEPLDRDELFSIWPIVLPVRDENVVFHPGTEQLVRSQAAARDLRGKRFSFELETAGLVDGVQVPLVPCQRPVNTDQLVEMPELPRLTALADRWLSERPTAARSQSAAARWLQKKFNSSDRFQYSLQGQERDTLIDPIEDFVSNHPRGHCEYFATALALMLRSQGIPSRVVLGFRCDEWNDVGKFYQVRQLHAHAWVEAYLPPRELPPELLAGEDRPRWILGGWLRLDPTPAADIGTAAADRSAWGQWKGRLHWLQSFWDDYVVEMDRQRQREAIFGPLRRAIRRLADPQWWRETAGRIADGLRMAAWRSLGGWLLAVALPLAACLFLLAFAARRLVRLARRAWRRLAARGVLPARRARSRVEFYRRLENLLARQGLVRPAGQTPREFALSAGVRLSRRAGPGEWAVWPLTVVDAFYQVRFGGRPLDKAQTQAVEHALAKLGGASGG